MRYATGLMALLLIALPMPSIACTCQSLDAIDSRSLADVVFAGVVERITMIDSEKEYEPRAIVTFRVARVWKGNVPGTFVMHTNLEFSSCAGFYRELAQPRAELLVYGSAFTGADWKRGRQPMPSNAGSATFMGGNGSKGPRLDAIADNETLYTTNICSGTKRWKDADLDRRDLGAFTIPKDAVTIDDPPSLEVPLELRDVPRHCWSIHGASDWQRVAAPPETRRLLALVAQAQDEDGAPNVRTNDVVDAWYRDSKGRIGLCRTLKDSTLRCGRVAAMFGPPTKDYPHWSFMGYEAPLCPSQLMKR